MASVGRERGSWEFGARKREVPTALPRMLIVFRYFASQDIMGIPLNAPLTAHSVVYTLPMLTIKEDKGKIAELS